jgi:hypothetical protein
MNQEWIKENFLQPRHLQNRTRIPNPPHLRALFATITSARLTEERQVRNFLANPDRYETYNYYNNTCERIQDFIDCPTCCYCADIPLEPQQNELCTHASCICEACFVMYFRNYRFQQPCDRKFKDGTRCTEIAQFRVRDLDPSKIVQHDQTNCAHGYVFRFSQMDTMQFRCPATGCPKLATMQTMKQCYPQLARHLITEICE